MTLRVAKFAIGQVVRHRFYPFRGIVFDVDPVFANTEELVARRFPAEMRPRKDQPFYHLLARERPRRSTSPTSRSRTSCRTRPRSRCATR